MWGSSTGVDLQARRRAGRLTRRGRYTRFDPVTVRAAARVVSLERIARIPRWELGYCLRELALMDGLPPAAARRLHLLALRLSSLGQAGVPRRRPARRQACRTLPLKAAA